VQVPRPDISSIPAAGTASRPIPLKASSARGSMEQGDGRSAPGEAGDLRLSFRETTLLAQGGARRFPAGAGGQHMLAGDRLAPVL
jgi:hypothetical protein